MSYRVTWTDAARRDLRRLDPEGARRILRTVSRFAETEHGDALQLTGVDPPEWRLRVGDYRVRFAWDSDQRGIIVLRVSHRREAYRD